MRTFALMIVLFASVSFAEELPSQSLYQYETALEDHSAQPRTLDVFKGQPVVVTMFYSSCTYACPIIISSIKRLESKLTPKAKGNLRVLLISMDPQKDTSEAMAKLVEGHGLDAGRWRLVRPVKKEDVADLAGLLGMTYRKNPDGSYSHSAEITLFDGNGVQVAKLDAPGDDSTDFVSKIEQLAGR